MKMQNGFPSTLVLRDVFRSNAKGTSKQKDVDKYNAINAEENMIFW